MEEHVRQIVCDILDIPGERIKEGLEMQNTPEWDSLRHMQLVMAIEQNFGVGPFTAEEIVGMTRYANIAGIIGKYLDNGSHPS